MAEMAGNDYHGTLCWCCGWQVGGRICIQRLENKDIVGSEHTGLEQSKETESERSQALSHHHGSNCTHGVQRTHWSKWSGFTSSVQYSPRRHGSSRSYPGMPRPFFAAYQMLSALLHRGHSMNSTSTLHGLSSVNAYDAYYNCIAAGGFCGNDGTCRRLSAAMPQIKPVKTCVRGPLGACKCATIYWICQD